MKLIRKFFINKTSLEEKINKNKFKVEIYTQFKKKNNELELFYKRFNRF